MPSDPFEAVRTAVLALDPGGTTGYAAFDRGRFESGELHGDFETQAQDLTELFFRVQPAIVVCETYTITQRTAQLSQQHEAIMLIGMVRWLVARASLQLHMQKPAQAKAFATDPKLKALGWSFVTKGGHRNDGARHLVTWMAGNGYFDKETLMRLAEAA